MALTKINASVIANNTIAVGNIADNSVDATKIASNSILTRHIDDNQVTADQIAAATITTTQIAANTIATGNVADNAIDGTKIASNSILTRHIDDDQVTGDQLSDNITIAGTLTSTGAFTSPGIDDNADATAITIDSSERVGIGETSPANLLHVKLSDAGIAPHTSAQIVLERDGTNYLQFLTTAAGTSGLLFGDTNDVDVSKIYVDHNTTKMTFVNETIETMTLNGAKVGIGTTSPDYPVEIEASNLSSGLPQFVVKGKDNDLTGIGLVAYGSNGSHRNWGIAANQSVAGALNIGYTANATNAPSTGNITSALLIDSSGKVGIGTTSPAGVLTVHKDVTGANDQEMLTIRRDAGATSDGARQASIAFFDGNNDTYTGKISGYRDAPAGNYDGGLRFYVNPHATNANGSFADLNGTPAMYLNPDRSMTTFGHVYMQNGSGISFALDEHASGMSNELLDDYEEGSWTPSFSTSASNGAFSVTVNYAKYIKVGGLVHVSCYVSAVISDAGSGAAQIGGLPFTNTSGQGYSVANFVHTSAITAQPTNGFAGYVTNGHTYIRVLSISGSPTNIGWQTGNPVYLMMSATYHSV